MESLTEAGGEPAVIQPVEQGSFENARFVFFAGSPAFGTLVAPLSGFRFFREQRAFLEAHGHMVAMNGDPAHDIPLAGSSNRSSNR